MAAPSYKVPSFSNDPRDEVVEFLLPATAATYYPGEMIGLDTAGYAVKFADAASVLFLGINAEAVDITVLSTDSAGDKRIKVKRPKEGFAMYIASAALTDVGKRCYAAFSNEVQYTTGTYGNYCGVVKAYLSATMVLIQPPGWGEKPVGVARAMAATGTQTLTKFDLNKTIIVPNTAALTLNLPAVADTQAGDTLTVVKTTTDAQAITLDGNASETIDGSTTLATLDAFYDTACLVSNGAMWTVLYRDIA
jgi:hypothetical protein